jgi:hypothetical protein
LGYAGIKVFSGAIGAGWNDSIFNCFATCHIGYTWEHLADHIDLGHTGCGVPEWGAVGTITLAGGLWSG